MDPTSAAIVKGVAAAAIVWFVYTAFEIVWHMATARTPLRERRRREMATAYEKHWSIITSVWTGSRSGRIVPCSFINGCLRELGEEFFVTSVNANIPVLQDMAAANQWLYGRKEAPAWPEDTEDLSVFF